MLVSHKVNFNLHDTESTYYNLANTSDKRQKDTAFNSENCSLPRRVLLLEQKKALPILNLVEGGCLMSNGLIFSKE